MSILHLFFLQISKNILFNCCWLSFFIKICYNALTQVVNDGGVNDYRSVLVSGFQWGLINTASEFLGSLGWPVSTLDRALLSVILGSVTSAVGMTIDILRNRKNQKQNVGVNNLHYAFSF